jgi:pyruvate dehydrogenase E2 component (dihydrolipoamide acetyltransferase)
MEKEVRVPDIGDFGEVEIIEVHVTVGDEISAEDDLITLESDKAAMDIPAPWAGVVSTLAIEVGDRIKEGDLILTLNESQNREPNAEDVTEPSASNTAAQDVVDTTEKQVPTEVVQASTISNQAAKNVAVAVPEIATNPSSNAHASPSVRQFARELGVDLSLVAASGRKNRVLQEDVTQFVKQSLSSGVSSSGGAVLPRVPELDFSKFGEIDTQPLSRINKLSGAHLQACWLNVPHVTQFDEVDISELEAFRQSMKGEATQRELRLTPLVFVMKTVVCALQAFPRFNASLSADGQSLIMKKYFHIGIAVDTPNGLMVPVIRDVDQKGIWALSEELMSLGNKARAGKLSPNDLQGGCFSISSLGGIGGTAFTPIVNAPEVAILGVSRSAMKPVYENGEFVPRLMLPLSLSYDHRVIDGAEGARFITHLNRLLGDIRTLLM